MSKRFLLVNLGLLFAGLIVLELVFGNWRSGSRINMIQVLKDVHLEYRVKGVGTEPEETVHYVRDQWGLRGKYPGPSQINILTLGASTTDQRYITEGKTWQDILSGCLSQKKESPIWVVNAGVDGHSIYGHLESFRTWFSEIPNLKAKYVVIYTGMIDYGALEQYGLKPHIPIKKRYNLWDRMVKKSALYHAYLLLRNRMEYPPATVTHGQSDLQDHGEIRTVESVENDASLEKEYVRKDVLENYKVRLLQIEKVIEDFGARAVFVSQRDMTYLLTQNKIESLRHQEGFGHYLRWKKMAEVAAQVCKETKTLCFNLAQELPFERTDFYDEGHNTAKGTHKIGLYLCEKFKNLPL